MSEKLYKYQIKEIKRVLKDICFFGVANGNNPFFDCSLRGDYNETFAIAKYISYFRPAIFTGPRVKPKLLWKGKAVADA